MLPIVFDWHWTVGRLIFMGLLYMVLGAVSLGLLVTFFKTLKDLKKGEPADNH